MKTSFFILSAVALHLASCASVQPTSSITEAQARKTALDAVHGGTVKSSELERESGKDIWSFDISQPGLKGIKEVAIDSHTGKVLEITLESEEQEKQEAAEEAAEKAHAADHALMGPGHRGKRGGR